MTHTIEIEELAHGGDGLGRLDGKVVFVPDTLPGETVQIEILDDRRDFAKARLVAVDVAAPTRREAPCPHFDRCGGCQWQFTDRATQAEAKRHTVAGQLRHLGGVEAPPVEPIVMPGPAFGYRNRMDFSVLEGRPALRERRSQTLVPIEACLLLSEELAELFGRIDNLGQLRSMTLRHGLGSGELLAVIDGDPPVSAADWDVPVVNLAGERIVGERSHVTEVVHGAEFRISGQSFFQNNTRGAELLVELVGSMLAIDRSDRLLDGFAGVGLFAATNGRAAGSVLCVESSPAVLGDLEHNLTEAAVPAPEILIDRFEEASDDDWTVAVVDPPRTGLKRPGVEVVTGPRPRAIAYVSCDPASFARDVRYLAETGYRLERAVPVDLFPQTFHIEVVGLFLPN